MFQWKYYSVTISCKTQCWEQLSKSGLWCSPLVEHASEVVVGSVVGHGLGIQRPVDGRLPPLHGQAVQLHCGRYTAYKKNDKVNSKAEIKTLILKCKHGGNLVSKVGNPVQPSDKSTNE